MKKSAKRYLANFLAVVMVLTSVFSLSLFAANDASAATLIPEHKFLNFFEEYEGPVESVYDANANANFIEYFNIDQELQTVPPFEAGNLYMVTFTIDGADNFQQLAVQSNVNGWDWALAPKLWMEGGITSGTVFSGIIEATANTVYTDEVPETFAFKYHLDNEVFPAAANAVITFSNMKIIPVSSSVAGIVDPALKYVDFDTSYAEAFTATVDSGNPDVFYVEYFNVTDSPVVAGEEYVILAKFSGVSAFKQVAIQSSINEWDWAGAAKKWDDNGVQDGSVIGGLFTATADADNIAFKIQLDNPVFGNASVTNATVALEDLVVIKVS